MSVFPSLYWTVAQSFWTEPHGIWFWEIKLFSLLQFFFLLCFTCLDIWPLRLLLFLLCLLLLFFPQLFINLYYYNVVNLSSILPSRRPLKHLQMVIDRESWCALLHGVSKSQIRLIDWAELNWMFMTNFFSFRIFLWEPFLKFFLLSYNIFWILCNRNSEPFFFFGPGCRTLNKSGGFY